MTVRRVHMIENPSVDFSRRYGLMAETLLVETNDPAILDAADASFGRFAVPDPPGEQIVVRVFRGPPAGSGAEVRDARRVHYRIDGHLLVFGGSSELATVDARSGVSAVFVSGATVADVRLLRIAFLEGPALASIMYCRGYLTVHAAGVGRDGVGIALVGGPGAGKSTLAVAAARRGLDVFAEDGVFARLGPSGLEFWGMPWTHRLVPEARPFFSELDGREPTLQANGELKIEIDLDELYPGRARPSARPGAIVFIDRNEGLGQGLVPVSADDAPLELLWPWGDHWSDAHEKAAVQLAELPRYRLLAGGTPDDAVDRIEALLGELTAPVRAR